MNLLKKIPSQVDKTIKYIFEVEKGLVVEYSYIDNGTGKDIICTPCQTMCNMSCKFCHLTDHIGKVKMKDLTSAQIVFGIDYISHDLNLQEEKPLLISYMGCGEPLANINEVLDSMTHLMSVWNNIRFGLATMLPKAKWFDFFTMMKEVEYHKIPLKVHLSLHFTEDKTRTEWMPSAWEIGYSLKALELYGSVTKNPTEVHYTVMEGANDNDLSITLLNKLIPTQTTIKLMRYSEKESLEVKEASMQNINQIKKFLLTENPDRVVEYYEPPGHDIGASCGQFLTDDILNPKENELHS